MKLQRPDKMTAAVGGACGVDDGGHRVGGVVEPVDELEAERDRQADEQKDERHIGRDLGAGRIDVGEEAVGDVKQSAGENADEQDNGQRIETLV